MIKPNYSVLIVEDEPDVLSLLSDMFEHEKAKVVTALTAEEALTELEKQKFDLYLIDVNLPKMNGLDLLSRVREIHTDAVCIMQSFVRDLDIVIEAIRRGAFWYTTKPIRGDSLFQLVEKAFSFKKLYIENSKLKSALSSNFELSSWVAESKATLKLEKQLIEAASSPATTVIVGESGSGKTTSASFLHAKGNLKTKGILNIGAQAFSILVKNEGFKGLSLDQVGTLVFEEIGDFPLACQGYLCDALDQNFGLADGQKIKIVATSSVPLEQAFSESRIRKSLFFRLGDDSILVPDLKERREDIFPVAKILLKEHCKDSSGDLSFDPQCEEIFLQHNWIGNFHELQNVIERIENSKIKNVLPPEEFKYLSNSKVSEKLLPGVSLGGIPLRELEQKAVYDTLDVCGGNKSKAARVLGISEKSIYNKLQRFNANKNKGLDL